MYVYPSAASLSKGGHPSPNSFPLPASSRSVQARLSKASKPSHKSRPKLHAPPPANLPSNPPSNPSRSSSLSSANYRPNTGPSSPSASAPAPPSSSATAPSPTKP
ncbi:hypothetical protein ACFX2H_034445 [Malus domestica]